MTLRANPSNLTFFCPIHQRELTAGQLVTVMLDSVKKECPDCAEDMPAQEAVIILEEAKRCVVHDGHGGQAAQAAVGTCIVCGHSLCGDCLKANRVCVFCDTRTKA